MCLSHNRQGMAIIPFCNHPPIDFVHYWQYLHDQTLKVWRPSFPVPIQLKLVQSITDVSTGNKNFLFVFFLLIIMNDYKDIYCFNEQEYTNPIHLEQDSNKEILYPPNFSFCKRMISII